MRITVAQPSDIEIITALSEYAATKLNRCIIFPVVNKNPYQISVISADDMVPLAVINNGNSIYSLVMLGGIINAEFKRAGVPAASHKQFKSRGVNRGGTS